MDISDLFNIFRWRKWVIITTVFMMMLVVSIITFLTPPLYSSSATLRIATASSSSTYSDFYFADRLIITYMNIATSRPLLEELQKQLNLQKTPAVSVKQIPNTELIQISVEDQNPQIAMEAANTLGNILISQGSAFYTGSDKSPAEILKEQVDKVGTELELLREKYYAHLANFPDDTEGNQINSEAVDLQQQLYFSLLSQYQTLLSRESIQSNIVSFVEKAIVPTTPSKPNLVVNFSLGFIISLITGFGLALLFDTFDTTLHSSKEINVVTELIPTIGRIPNIKAPRERIHTFDGNSRLDEAMSNLRINFMSLINESRLRSFLIVSPMQNEGKTMALSNLAFSLAQAGKKIILVDCDLRVPSLHRVFDIQNRDKGLSEFLIGKADYKDVITHTKSANLDVITAGLAARKPAVLLDSLKMKLLITKLLAEYELVFLDSPAILAVTDASVLAPKVDGVILITRIGVTKKEKLIESIEQLNNVKARILGVVINGDKSKNIYTSYSRRVLAQKGDKSNGSRG